jgi:hypothetical protein
MSERKAELGDDPGLTREGQQSEESATAGSTGEGGGAGGRENPITDRVDADEALGNRTGGYGGSGGPGEEPAPE